MGEKTCALTFTFKGSFYRCKHINIDHTSKQQQQLPEVLEGC